MKRPRKSSALQRQAESVAAALPRSRLHPAVLRWVAGHRQTGTWGIAFSGGADSLALLLLLWAHWPAARDKLVVLHFNHRLRGRASSADEKFCRRICAALGVKLVVGAWVVGRVLRPTVGHKARPTVSEAAARAARHAFFAREMKRRGGRALWLAHQQDDIAETMLMRLARGSGTAGLAAPRPVQPTAERHVNLRPLLTVKKQELMRVLREAGIKWREDASNEGRDFFRNRIRHVVLPAWQKAAERDAQAGAALARELLEEDDSALEAWLDRLAPLKRGVMEVRLLGGVPRAVVRRALHRWMMAVRPETDLSRQGFELLLDAVVRGTATRFSLGRRGFAVIRQGKLSFKRG